MKGKISFEKLNILYEVSKIVNSTLDLREGKNMGRK